MGVSCNLYLRDDVRIDDVSTVMGILAGLPVEEVELRGASGGSYASVFCARPKPSNSPEMVIIELEGNLIDGQAGHFCFFHYEHEKQARYRLLSMASTPFWCAIAKELVEFFGGYVDYKDTDNVKVDFKAAGKFKKNNPVEDAEWQAFQNAILKIKPLTKKDLNEAKKYSYWEAWE